MIRNKHASFARFVHIRMLFYVIFLFRVKLFSHIVIVCVVFLTLVSCFIRIQNQNPPRSSCPIERNIILRVIQASHPACHPGVSMHADEFFSTALEEVSAALVHHKVVLAPKLFGGTPPPGTPINVVFS